MTVSVRIWPESYVVLFKTKQTSNCVEFNTLYLEIEFGLNSEMFAAFCVIV